MRLEADVNKMKLLRKVKHMKTKRKEKTLKKTTLTKDIG